MNTHTLRKLAGLVGAGLVVAAPIIAQIAPPEAKQHVQELVASLGGVLAWLGHAPDAKKPEAPASEGE